MSTNLDAFNQALVKDRDATSRRILKNNLNNTRERLHEVEEGWAEEMKFSPEDILALGRVRGILSTIIEKLK